MAIPFKYNVRNMILRKRLTLMTAFLAGCLLATAATESRIAEAPSAVVPVPA